MKVFKATAGEWESGQSHYLIAAENIDQAYDYLCTNTNSNIDYDSIWHLDNVYTNVTKPVILEEF